MTPHPQPKEYIITEEDIQILEDSFGVTMIMPRSRPHTCNIMTCAKAIDECLDPRPHTPVAPDCDNCRKVHYLEQNGIALMDMIKEQNITIRNQTLAEPRDCATCNNKHNAAKYVKRINACSMRVHMKKEMDNLKSCCPECRCNGEFKFDEIKCNGYSGRCKKSSCKDFRWWHAKCYCKIIREYDEKKESLRTQSTEATDR